MGKGEAEMWKLLTASLALTLAVECLIAWLWGLRRL